MKHLLCLLLAFAGLQAAAQKLNENSIVKDTLGNVYSYNIWRPLLVKGEHIIKPEKKDDPNTAFVIIRLTPEEKEARMARMKAPKESNFFRTGQKFSLEKVKDINGNKIDLKDNKGKITVINYWFINCPPCRMEIPDLNNLVDKYSSDSVRFIAIALDYQYDLEKFLKMMPFKYNIVEDGRYYAEKNRIQSYPTHVVVDQEGKVYFHTSGLSSNTVYWIEKSIKELMNKTAAAPASIN